MPVIGWDIGGVNTKVARVDGGVVTDARQEPFELQRAPERLPAVLERLATVVAAPADAPHALTMTAELSQMFRTKREGVAFVLDAAARVFGEATLHVYTTADAFLTPGEARRQPLTVAAANWAATAQLVAMRHPNTVLIDIGTTTTDLIPIVEGRVAAEGRTDPDRLATGELVYTGALRTPVEAIVSHVTIGGRRLGVSAEGFALVGDAHVWRGDLHAEYYTVATPDGRPATTEFARERLARLVCADREMLGDEAISALANEIVSAQQARIVAALRRLLARHPSIRTTVVAGLGAFIARECGRAAGLEVSVLASELGDDAARFAPAAAVALLLASRIDTA